MALWRTAVSADLSCPPSQLYGAFTQLAWERPRLPLPVRVDILDRSETVRQGVERYEGRGWGELLASGRHEADTFLARMIRLLSGVFVQLTL